MSTAGGWLINRNYAQLWYGQAVSLLGTAMFDTTLVLWVGTVLTRGRSWAPAAVSGVLVAVAVGTLVAPVAGVLVDRWNRRRTMMGADALRAALAGFLGAMSFLPVDRIPLVVWLVLVYLVVILLNAAGQFFNPARMAVIGDVVPDTQDRARASGIGQTTYAVVSIVGPPLAAPLLFTTGMSWALLLNAVSFAVSYLAIRSVRVTPVTSGDAQPARDSDPQPAGDSDAEPAGSRRMWREFVGGLRFLRASRVLVVLLVTIVVANAGGATLNALGVFFVTDNLHAPARWYGTIEMAIGIGAVAGAAVSGRLVGRFGAARMLYTGLLVAGLLLLVYARLSNLPTAIVLLALIGMPLAVLNVAIMPLLLGATPSEYVGRVFSTIDLAQQAAATLSAVLAGWLASTVLLGLHASVAGIHFGRIDTVFLASGLVIILGGLFAMTGLRGADGPRAGPELPAGSGVPATGEPTAEPAT